MPRYRSMALGSNIFRVGVLSWHVGSSRYPRNHTIASAQVQEYKRLEITGIKHPHGYRTITFPATCRQICCCRSPQHGITRRCCAPLPTARSTTRRTAPLSTTPPKTTTHTDNIDRAICICILYTCDGNIIQLHTPANSSLIRHPHAMSSE